jgi:hypothetical protein
MNLDCLWGTFNDLSHVRHHVEFNSKHFVVKICAIVLADSPLSVFGSFKGHGGRTEELTKLIAVESAHSEVADLLEKLFQIIVCDLFLVEISNLKSHIGWLENLLLDNLVGQLSAVVGSSDSQGPGGLSFVG